MKFSAKDTSGLFLILGTMGALAFHIGPDGHAAKHPTPVADAGGSVTTAIESTTVVFLDVNVVPMDRNRVLRHQVVVVTDGFIERVGPVGVVEPPMGARKIQGDGSQYLAPGLTDAHVHLDEGAESWLPLFLANGVTTVFNLRGEERHLTLRDRIRSEDVVGPTMYTSGPFTNEPEVTTPDQAAAAVRAQADRGYDFVKVHGELSEEAYARLLEVGVEKGIAIVGHAPRNLPFARVLEGRQASVAHAEELIYTGLNSLDPDKLDQVATEMSAAGTWLTPTISTFANIASQWGTTDGLEAGLRSDAAGYAPQSLRDSWRSRNVYIRKDPNGQSQINAMRDFHVPMVRVLGRAGIPMLAGTDAPLPVMVPGFSLHDEIDALASAGLGRFGALEAATSNAGRFIREFVDENSSFGTVTRGARADLVLLGSNPLNDLSALRRPQGVMVRGQWLDRAALDRMLDEVAIRR